MNILFFTHEKAYAGASSVLITLIDELIKKNYNIYVVVPFKKSKIVEKLKERKVNVITCFYSWWQVPINISKIKKFIFKVLYKFNFIAEIILTHKIKKLNIDIIHSNTSVIDIGAKVSKKLGIKHIWHFREFTGSYLKFIKSEKKSYEFINSNTTKIIYISKSLKEFYEKNIDNKLGVLIYDGVSEKYITFKTKRIDNIIKFLLVATIEENKGQDIVIEACNILRKKNINNFKLYLAGSNPTNYLKKIEEKIKNYNLLENVEYVGYVNDIVEFRKNVDVELMCSNFEAFGLVTVEAMLAQSIVIGSNSSATPEIIKDKETGYLYNQGDYYDLACKMEYVIKNKKKLNNLSKKASEYAKENFSSKTHGNKIVELYKKINEEDI